MTRTRVSSFIPPTLLVSLDIDIDMAPVAVAAVMLAFLARQPNFLPASSIEAVKRMTERSSFNAGDSFATAAVLVFPAEEEEEETKNEDGICSSGGNKEKTI